MARLFEDRQSGLFLPVPGDPPVGRPYVSQGYGPENTDPAVRHYYARGYHPGIDIAGVPEGTAILSADAGTVTIAGVFEGKGNTVGITRGDGLLAIYGHMTRIGVSLGDPVVVGDVLGGVGHTGVAEGNHVHYEVRRNGMDIDPAPSLKTPGQGGGGRTQPDVTPEGITATVREPLNLRAGPSMDEAILRVAPAGTPVTVGQDGWVPVMCDGQGGWMYGEYLAVAAQEGTEAGFMATVREDLNLRAGPSTGERVIRVAPTGTVVRIGRGSWVPVEVDGRAGWMSAEYLGIR